MLSASPRDREKDMDFWYSSDKWKGILGADEAETICVPPCLDVLKNWKRNDLDEALHLAPNISGQKGEAAFMLKFQELNMGGILVSGLQFHELEASRAVRKELIQKGEWDVIFFHQNRGIFVIEVKAVEVNDEDIVNKRRKKAKMQLDKNIEKIMHSFRMLYQKECAYVTGFICFPFRNEDRDSYEGYRVIDKSALDDHALLRKFFEPQTNETTIEVFLLRSFAAEFVCCRSKVEFHSQAYNAMQVATWIMEHDIARKQDPTKLVNVPGNGPSGKIILTAQQLEIVECREKCITIYGAPGSGKTLIVMLRALKAAMENKAGSVFVFVNEKLKAKYEHYFLEEEDKIFVNNHQNIDRRPKVHTIDKINFVKPEDDVFFDETPVEDSYIEKVESRVNCSGSTTVVFTGLYKPGDAVTSFRLYRPRLQQFKHFELMKVLRGTGNIFEKWEQYYPLGITIGHNIHGVAVKTDIFDSFEQVQNEIANKIATLTSANISNIDLPSLKKEHIAVITCDDNDSTEMRNYFKTKDILCGQVNDQARKLKDSSIVAVDVYLNTPSYEWPIVFVVLKPGITEEEILPIAASRSIASLSIYTYRNLQSKSPELVATQEIKNVLCAQQALKKIYLTRFKTVYPFSLPFTFDIENTWVSLAIKGNWKNSLETEDHAKLIEKAFEKDANYPHNEIKILIIEGDPATGKTSLMRKLAYEWAKGEQGLLCYDLVVYGELREVRGQSIKRVTDLVLECSKKYFSDRKNSLNNQSYENLKELMNNEQFCEKHKILVLLDGYDESSLEKQCTELNSYLSAKTIDDTPLLNIVVTTRKGYLSYLHRRKGRFVFAEVLGFTTDEQKKKYIVNHFASVKNSAVHIAAVHCLLNKNKNLNKLAVTPLFLTFICLVHERIIDGTQLELYCNIIWWLIDRHQQDFPDRDIPALFGFQNYSGDKFEAIQDHYLHFPQLLCLGNMALRSLQDNVIKPSDCAQFNLQPIIEQVGLMRKEKKYDNSFKLATSFHFPHRTIQEFLAAFYCLCSNDPISERLLPGSTLDTSNIAMGEFERFLLRIALSDQMPINTEKRKCYFEKIADIEIDVSFEAFNKIAGFNNKLLIWFLSQCTNVQNIQVNGKVNRAGHGSHILKSIFAHDTSTIISSMSNPTLFLISDLIKLRSMIFWKCTFEANSQLSFTNCPSLKNLQFSNCKINSTNLDIAALPAIDSVLFKECTFEKKSPLSITNYKTLKNLHFNRCEMKSTIIGISTLPAIDTVEFQECTIGSATWQSITDQIGNSSVKCLKLFFKEDINKEYLNYVQKCKNIEKVKIKILGDCIIRQNDLLSFSDLMKLHSVTFELQALSFDKCKFEANSQLSFTNCPSLNSLKFHGCEIKSSTNLGIAILQAIDSVLFEECKFQANSQLSFTNCPSLKIIKFHGCEIKSHTKLDIATLPAIDIIEFYGCQINLISWQSITDQIRNSPVKCLLLSVDYFVKEPYYDFLYHLQKCNCIQQIHVKDVYDSVLNRYEKEVTVNLAKIAQKIAGLMSIIISNGYGSRLDASRRLSEMNKERIEKAGQERNPDFTVKYVEQSLSRGGIVKKTNVSSEFSLIRDISQLSY